MNYVVNRHEMKRCDQTIIKKMGVPSMVLMERAALSVRNELCDGSFDLTSVLVVCGTGNNGGDGFALARLLFLQGVTVEVLFVGEENRCSVETKQQIQIIRNYGIPIRDRANYVNFTTIVDALFGIGLSRPIEGKYRTVIESINQSAVKVLSIDIPSGIDADSGRVLGVAVRAKKTVSLAYQKMGLLFYPGASYAGQVMVKDIGITDVGFEGELPKVFTYTKADVFRLPRRKKDAHKGTYGKVLVVAGGPQMSGAAYFAAKSAYRMGAGLVKIYTNHVNRSIIQSMLPESIMESYNMEQIDLDQLSHAIQWASVIIVGPGMGMEAHVKEILAKVFSESRVPTVVDADALNMIAAYPDLLATYPKTTIVTPHLGEMARLVGHEVESVKESMIEHAESYAKEKNVICVLKDVRTVVTDGKGTVYLNQSGHHGMATAGSGDVLTGVIAGLLTHQMDPFQAATLGVYLHGLAGEQAAHNLGGYAVMAEDIVAHLSQVTRISDFVQ